MHLDRNKLFIFLFFLIFLVIEQGKAAQNVVADTNTSVGQSITSPVNWKNKNLIFLELLGVGELYSVNYSRIIAQSKELKIFIRGGFSFIPARRVAFPLGVGLLLGKTKSHFEIGYTIMPIQTHAENYNDYYYDYNYGFNHYIPVLDFFNIKQSLNFGYKLLPKKGKGFVLGATLVLFLPSLNLIRGKDIYNDGILTEEDFYIFPYLNLQFGYIF